ncbi:DUF4160 domain-containing protein [Hypericibacter sp.]|uniref:DUF4160 domain-containing protein n=1 Tax=Hypericibacter sp. TaxID=2705401 RepID=UPI003D6C9A7F
MATVLRERGYRVVIYPNDHRPAHVHVIKAESEALFGLHCPGGPPALRENYSFSRQDLRRIEMIFAGRLRYLCERWRAIHGAA